MAYSINFFFLQIIPSISIAKVREHIKVDMRGLKVSSVAVLSS